MWVYSSIEWVLPTKSVHFSSIEGCSEVLLNSAFDSSFIQNEFRKILTGQIEIPDFILWREVKLGSYKLKSSNPTDQALHEGETSFQKLIANNSSLPPAAIISIKRISEDERDIPLYKEKIPYLVVYGAPGVVTGLLYEV